MSDGLPLFDHARSRAVLIGTWEYDHLTPVPAAEHSLRRMYELLTGPHCGWPKERVTVLHNEPGPGSLPDRLLDVFEDATDVALFYYVGHGQLDNDDQLCLGLVGSRTEGHRRATTSLEFSDVRRALRHCRAATKVVMLDCCFSGIATFREHALAGSAGEVLVDLASRTGAYTMTASSADTTAWFEADPDLPQPQTYFTKYFADLVEAGIPGEPAGLKLHPLFTELHDNLARDGRPVPQKRSVDAARDFVFARNAAPPETIVGPDAEVVRLRRELEELRKAQHRLTEATAAQAAARAAQERIVAGVNIIEHRLANGLRVVLSEDHSTPVAAVNIWYDVGSRHETRGRTGLAHLFCMLMYYGSASVRDNGHFEYVQGAGGSLNGTTSFERSNYFQTVPAHQLELVFWLEADRMGSLLVAMDENAMQRARDTVRNERRQRYDNVHYGTAFEKLTAKVYPEGHPYHHTPIGSDADRDAVTLAEARAFFRAYYTPDNAVLSVVGDIDPEQTIAWIEKYFGSIPSPGRKPPVRDGSLPDLIGTELREAVEGYVPDPALMAAYRLPRDGKRACAAADLALSILGGGESSRLYNRLVRQDRIASEAGFGLLRLAGAPCLGWLDVKAAGYATTYDLEDAVDEELARFAADGPTPEELERAQAQLEREWLDRLATVAGRADELCRFAVLFGDPQLVWSALGNILTITPEEVRAVVARYLVRNNRAVLTYNSIDPYDDL